MDSKKDSIDRIQVYNVGRKQVIVDFDSLTNSINTIKYVITKIMELRCASANMQDMLTQHYVAPHRQMFLENCIQLTSTLQHIIYNLHLATERLHDTLVNAYAYYQAIEKRNTSLFNNIFQQKNNELANIKNWRANAIYSWAFIHNSMLSPLDYLFTLFSNNTKANYFATASLAFSALLRRRNYRLDITPIIGSRQNASKPPLNSAQLLAQYENVYPKNPDEGMLRVTKYNTGGKIAWRVEIPGTQEFTLNDTTPHDMSTNFLANAGLQTDMNKAVAEVLEKSGYSAGQPIELVGHSQGAAVAVALGTSLKWQKKHRVVSVLATGGNIGTPKPVNNVRILSYENNADIVPALDGNNNASRKNLTVVKAVLPKSEGVVKTHSRKNYQNIAKVAECKELPAVKQWDMHRLQELGINENTKMQTRDYKIVRRYQPTEREVGKMR